MSAGRVAMLAVLTILTGALLVAPMQVGTAAERPRTSAVAHPHAVAQAVHRNIRVGQRTRVELTVEGLPSHYRARADARLYGPFRTRASIGCAGDPRAQQYGRVLFTVTNDGDYRSPAIRVHRYGYYAWVVRVPASRTSAAARTRCASTGSVVTAWRQRVA